MDEKGIKDIVAKKLEHYKNKLKIKELQLDALLDITNSINSSTDTIEIIEKYRGFVKDQLGIEKLVLYSFMTEWKCLLYYGLEDGELVGIDVLRDLLEYKDITSITSDPKESLKNFDMVVPVMQGEKQLAFLLLGDVNNDEVSVSSIIKHLNFLQLLTNIVVSALENERLAMALLTEEQEKRLLTEKQNEMLEVLVQERTKELRQEKEESERLLHNILPESVAEELKHKGHTTPHRYNEVSILFTDFKGFTTISSTISANKLVGELNDIFKTFDHLMGKFGLEKIKTIGDSYMAACGLPRESRAHAVQCVRAAKSMIAFLAKRAETADIKWEMRVGINSGPLVAGVVGTKKFTYDIWGDTVNIAARMESNGHEGMINISARTFEAISAYYECEYRGKLNAKGKGEMDMYFVGEEKTPERLVKLKEYVFGRLEKELPENLFYHGIHHTKDVCDNVLTIGLNEGLSKGELDVLQAGALLHDIGFIKQYNSNEEIAAAMAPEILRMFEYNEDEIETIQGMIMATKLPQSPKNTLEEIICDADLDYLGRSNYKEIAHTFYQELTAHGVHMDEAQWTKMQVDFLKQHKYFTKAAIDLRDDGKQRTLEKLS